MRLPSNNDKDETPRTDELKLIPTVLAVTATGFCTCTKTTQSSAVKNVLPARDNRRPSLGHSINHAPNLLPACQRPQSRRTAPRTKRTTAPGIPPIVKMTTSQRVLSSDDVCARLSTPRVSSSLGRYTLNMVYASAIPNHAPHTSTVVRRHSGSRTILKRPNQARKGRLIFRGSTQYARSATSYNEERTEEKVSPRGRCGRDGRGRAGRKSRSSAGTSSSLGGGGVYAARGA